MTRVGLSGHQRLPVEVKRYAERKIRMVLEAQSAPLIGMCSLAEGADQLFAELVLEIGGELHAVIPCRGYNDTLQGDARKAYCRFIVEAQAVTTLPYDAPGEIAYDAAGLFIAQQCDLFIAVWDGKPARGLGGTADAVAHARRLGRDVVVVWPDGVSRT